MLSRTPFHTALIATTIWARRAAKSGLPLLLFLAMLLGALPPTTHASGSGKVHDQLLREANASPSRSFRVIVKRATSDTGADAKVKHLGGIKIKDLQANAFVAMVKAKDLRALGNDPSVQYVTKDAEMVNTGAIDTSKLATMYPAVQSATTLWGGTSPLTGAGIGVAVLDTGIAQAPDFNDANGKSRIVAQQAFNSSTKSMSDGMGHGTHVAGIIAGNSWRNGTSAVQGKYVGVAPEANLINVKVSDDTGQSYISDVINAIDWVITNRTTYNIRVMNLSLVSGTAESYTTSVLDAAVERAWFNGILVVVAAGNNGANTMQYPPANDPFVITVGASDPMNTVAKGDDTMAPWSSYGTTQDSFSKPDVVATGRYMLSVLASGGCTLAKTFPDRIVDSNYIRMSGTSMASPLVAGLGALAFQAHPGWTNDQVKWLLSNTATPLGTTTTTSTTDPATGQATTSSTFTPYPGSGAGEVDGAAVAQYSQVPQYSNQGLTISPLLVSSNGTTYTTGMTASWSSSTSSTSTSGTANTSTSTWSSSTWASSTWSQ